MASELETQKAAGITTSKDKDGKVDLHAKTKITGTGKGPLEKDKSYEVHPIHAETLKKKGFAK
ncbi:MAG: hypothetical protein J7599_07510 [Niabella sp.]|nr:hypothetical protein [Niabella sp.]